MGTTKGARVELSNGRASSKLAARLRENIASGAISSGLFMPTERQLAAEHGMAKMTVRRALKTLEREGLVAALPRQGYRVLARATDPDRGLPVAYIAHSPGQGEEFWDDFHRSLLVEFQQVAAQKGWSLLAVAAGEQTAGQVVEQVRSAAVCGAILDHTREDILDQLREAGIPAVVVDGLPDDVSVSDVAVQDGFFGGVQAVGHLAGRGHRRIGWLGAEPTQKELQIIERYSGAMAGMELAGLRFSPDLDFRAPLGDPELAARQARELLSLRDRPTAVLTLWQAMTRALVRAAGELRLVPGKDFEMVGWSTEEQYESEFVPQFEAGRVPAAVTWSVRRMAETAMRMLKQRRAEPGMPPVLVKIPTGLRPGSETV